MLALTAIDKLGMLRPSSCLFWLVQAFLLITVLKFCLAQNVTSPTEGDLEETVDENVIYIIVAILFVFFGSITVVIIVSLLQTKNRPIAAYRGDGRVTEIPGKQNAAYETNSIGGLDEDLPTAWWEIEGNRLKIDTTTILGSGQFGVILLGEVIENNGQRTKCAVKTLKAGASHAEKQSLINELQNMSTMDSHPNIVNLIGAQTRLGVLYVVVEYCVNGDLFNYVRKNRVDLSNMGRKECGTSIEYVTRLRFAFDIANGMDYLTTKGFIHRDLATRNVLLDGEMRAKVSDFGRARDISENYEIFQSVRKNEPVPTRWMPVETLSHQIFSKKSDVWSFGVLLWEIESGGTRPYNDQHTYSQVVEKVVKEGYRLQQPYNCPDVIYEIMRECWKIDPDERPTFRQISGNIGNLLAAHLPVGAPPEYTT